MNCQTFQHELSELGISTKAATPMAREHLATCAACRHQMNSLKATFALLDTWQAPEPSSYFDQKLGVLLREEQAKPAAGWFERLQSRLLFNTGRQFRPALAGTFAVALLLGGGTFAGISSLPSHQQPMQVSAAVDDLQILDKNDQALQQMDQLLQEEHQEEQSAPPRT